MSLAQADTLESYANITNKSVSSNLNPASVAQNYQYNGPQVHRNPLHTAVHYHLVWPGIRDSHFLGIFTQYNAQDYLNIYFT